MSNIRVMTYEFKVGYEWSGSYSNGYFKEYDWLTINTDNIVSCSELLKRSYSTYTKKHYTEVCGWFIKRPKVKYKYVEEENEVSFYVVNLSNGESILTTEKLL